MELRTVGGAIGSGSKGGAAALGLELSLASGRAVASLVGKTLPVGGRIELLELDIAGIKFPFDLSGGATQFRHRRTQLGQLLFSVGGEDLRGLAAPEACARMGLHDLRVDLQGTQLHVTARVRLAGREADMVAVAGIRRVGTQDLRLSFFDVRVYGFLPVAAPVLPLALFQALAASADFLAAPSPLLRVVGPSDLELSILELILFSLLPKHGWRMPLRRQVRLLPVAHEGGRLILRFDGSAGDPDREMDEAPLDAFQTQARAPELLAYEEGRAAFPEAEIALLEGDAELALTTYRRAVTLGTPPPFVLSRLLTLLLATPAHWNEAEEMAGAVLARMPDHTGALLAQAAIAGERGRHAEAGHIYERLADLAAQRARLEDEASASTAAGRAFAKAGQGERSLALAQRAQNVAPWHRGGARLLADQLLAEQRWADLLKLLARQIADEPVDGERARMLATSGRIYLDRIGDAERARQKFDQALALDSDNPVAWEGVARLNRLAGRAGDVRTALLRALECFAARDDLAGQSRVEVALADLDQLEGDDDAAALRLVRAAELDVDGLEALRALGDLALRRAQAEEAIVVYQKLFTRAQRPSERALALRRLATVRRSLLSEVMTARQLLERALREVPDDTETLDDLQSLLTDQGVADEMETFLRRAAVQSSSDARRLAALSRLADLGRAGNLPRVLREALNDLVAGHGPETARAALELGALALAGQSGEGSDAAFVADVAVRLEALLEEPGADWGPASAWAAVSSRLAELRERLGDEDAALSWLRVCIEGEPAVELLSGAWERFTKLAVHRGDPLAAAQALCAWADDPRTGEADVVRAGHLVAAGRIYHERLGFPADAALVLERAVALDGDHQEAANLLVDMLVATGAIDKAVAVIERRLQRPGVEETWFHRLADLLEKQHRGTEAAMALRQLLSRSPSDRGAMWRLARIAWQTGDKAEGARLYGLLAERDAGGDGADPSAEAEAHLRLGHWARVVGRVSEANRHVEEGVAREPGVGASPEILVEVLEAFGRTQDLIGLLEARERVTSDPKALRAVLRARAGVCERMGRGDEAARLYQRLLEGDPDDVLALSQLAELWRREGLTAALVEPLERLFLLADQDSPASADLDAEVIGLELAAALAGLGKETLPGSGVRAEATLRRVLERNPGNLEALSALSALLLDRGAVNEADETLARRIEAEGTGVEGAHALVELAAQRARDPGGELSALALLRRVERDALPVAGLRLRAQLALGIGDLNDALAALRQAWSVATGGVRAEIAGELLSVLERPTADLGAALVVMEELADASPREVALGESLVRMYGRLPDLRARHRAWAQLLSRYPDLCAATQGKILCALAVEFESNGDVARAETTFRQALALDADAGLRVRELVGHARTLLALKQVEDAEYDLEEALSLSPDDAEALFVRGELAYRNQDWERAREAIERLQAAPGWNQVMAPERLAFRRAELAEVFGDEAAAEAAYSEVVRLEPRQIEAREALLQIAIYRQDRAAAIRWLEELLRLYPVEAVEKMRDARERIGQLRLEQGDLTAARHHLELVLSEEPERITALFSLKEVYKAQDLPRDEAAVLGRLGRLLPQSHERAQALVEQGEILSQRLGDDEGAIDAYLRGLDVDPRSIVASSRLVRLYLRRGALAEALDVGADVSVDDQGSDPALQNLRALVTLAAVFAPEPDRLALLWPRASKAALVAALLDVVEEPAGGAVEELRDRVIELRGPQGEADLNLMRDELLRLHAAAQGDEQARLARWIEAWPTP